jgi:hypothetical protein
LEKDGLKAFFESKGKSASNSWLFGNERLVINAQTILFGKRKHGSTTQERKKEYMKIVRDE